MQFRKSATRVVEEFTIEGFAMDDERLKRGGSVLSDLSPRARRESANAVRSAVAARSFTPAALSA